MINDSNSVLEKVFSLCKRRGFFFQSYDIYGGLNGIYDRGHLGFLLEKKIIDYWTNQIKNCGYPIIHYDGSLIGSKDAWKASGHVDGFHDPLIDCKACKVRYRTDEINLEKNCPRCGNKNWGDIKQFNMMFATNLGASEDSSQIAYLRPETAQSIFVSFKNIINTSRVKVPFGVIQIGKAFRNEITPRQFLFRLREFSQMEMEFFVHPKDAWSFFEFWKNERVQFYKKLGFKDNFKARDYEKDELAHYSSATCDIEFNFPFGLKELEGIAYRTDFDLKSHSEASKKDLNLFCDETKSSYVPHVVECSVGVERIILAILCNSYFEEKCDDEVRIVLKLPIFLAPVQIAIFPLTKNEEELARKIYKNLINDKFECQYDESGSIGKRYRRQDEIGTPFCVTIDSNSNLKNTVTVRDRDSMSQEIVSIEKLNEFFNRKFKNIYN